MVAKFENQSFRIFPRKLSVMWSGREAIAQHGQSCWIVRCDQRLEIVDAGELLVPGVGMLDRLNPRIIELAHGVLVSCRDIGATRTIYVNHGLSPGFVITESSEEWANGFAIACGYQSFDALFVRYAPVMNFTGYLLAVEKI